MEEIQYSVSTQNKDKKENETHIFRHPSAIGKPLASFLTCSTLQQVYTKCLNNPSSPLLGKRKQNPDGSFEKKYSWYSVKKVMETAEKFGSGLTNLGLIEKVK